MKRKKRFSRRSVFRNGVKRDGRLPEPFEVYLARLLFLVLPEPFG